MSVTFYDEALIQKLKYWTEYTDVHVYNVEESRRLLEVIANETSDSNIKLPIISLQRTDGFTIKNTNKRPLTFEGLKFQTGDKQRLDQLEYEYNNKLITRAEYNKRLAELQSVSSNSSAAVLNAIPIVLPYTLSVYTRTQSENDVYIRNLIFNLINYPTVAVKFKYNGQDIQHDSNIILGDTVSNTSSSVKLFHDQICKQTLSFKIDDAYLWDVRLLNTLDPICGSFAIAIKDKEDFIIENINIKEISLNE